MCSRMPSPTQQRQLLSRCVCKCTEDADTQSCDEEVADIMTAAEQDCICQTYGSTDATTDQKTRCRLCSARGSDVDRRLSPCQLYSPEPDTSETYISRRIEQTIRTLSSSAFVNNLLGQMDGQMDPQIDACDTFEPVISVTDDPAGDPYNNQSSTPPSAFRNCRRTLKPNVIPAESFMRNYYHPYERPEDGGELCRPYDRVIATDSPVDQPRRPYASYNSRYPDNFDFRHPYRKYMKRPSTSTDDQAINTTSNPRAFCRRGYNKPRSRGVLSDCGNETGYDVDQQFFEERRKQDNVFSTGFEILCKVLRKLYV